MSGRPPIIKELDKYLTLVCWDGDKGETRDDMECIAFLPKSAKKKYHGEKVSVVLRGRRYLDPYTGDIWKKKGWVVAIPIEDYHTEKPIESEIQICPSVNPGYLKVNFTVKLGEMSMTIPRYVGREVLSWSGKKVRDVLEQYCPEWFREYFEKSNIIINKDSQKLVFRYDEKEGALKVALVDTHIPSLSIEYTEGENNEYEVTAHVSTEGDTFVVTTKKKIKIYIASLDMLDREIGIDTIKVSVNTIPELSESLVEEGAVVQYLTEDFKLLRDNVIRYLLWYNPREASEFRIPLTAEIVLKNGDTDKRNMYEISDIDKFWKTVKERNIRVDTKEAEESLKNFLEPYRKKYLEEVREKKAKLEEELEAEKQNLQHINTYGVTNDYKLMTKEELRKYIEEQADIENEIEGCPVSDGDLSVLPEKVFVRTEFWECVTVNFIVTPDGKRYTAKCVSLNCYEETDDFEDGEPKTSFEIKEEEDKYDKEQAEDEVKTKIAELGEQIQHFSEYENRLQQPVEKAFSNIFENYIRKKNEVSKNE